MRSRALVRRPGSGHRVADRAEQCDSFGKGPRPHPIARSAPLFYLPAGRSRVMTGASRTPLAAGIVAYRPDPGLLARLISSLAPQVDLLLLYRNSSIPAHLFDLAQIHVDRIRVIGNGRNLGLGVAYNRIVDAAMACG